MKNRIGNACDEHDMMISVCFMPKIIHELYYMYH